MATEICSRSEPCTTNYTINQNQVLGRQKDYQRKLETEASLLQGQHFIFSQTKLNSDVENKLLNKGNLLCGRGGIKGSKDDELVKYMSNLPGYLRRHASRNKNEQEKALSVGVLDWSRLERWKKKQTHTLQTDTSISTSGVSFSGSVQNSTSFRDKSDPEGDYSLRDGEINLNFPSVEQHQKIVLLLPKDLPRNSFSNSSQSREVDDRICDVRRSFSDVIYPTYTNPTSEIPHSCPLPYTPRVTPWPTEGKRTQCDNLLRNFTDTCSSKGLRISSGIGNVGRSLSVAERSTTGTRTRILSSNGPSVPAKLTKDDGRKANALGRSRSSPLRRLLDPVLKPWSDKAEKQKSCRGHEASDGCDLTRVTSVDSSPIPALLQLRFKNGFPLFKFVAEGNNGEALVATLKKSDDSLSETSHWVYTFYSVREAKKKNRGWAHPGKKEKGRYVYGVVGWMNVTGSKDRSTVKSVLLGDDCGQQRELAAIITEVPNSASEWGYGRNDASESGYVCGMHGDSHRVNPFEGRNSPNKTTTVILPNGIHGVPSEGLPSCLVDRWRSGGSCDCGGWDIGCQIKVLKNQDALEASSSSSRNIFRMFFQGKSERPALMMVGRKEGIYSVKLDATLSLLQAFSICVSFLPPQVVEAEEEEEEEQGGRRYTTPFPPPSPAGRV